MLYTRRLSIKVGQGLLGPYGGVPGRVFIGSSVLGYFGRDMLNQITCSLSIGGAQVII